MPRILTLAPRRNRTWRRIGLEAGELLDLPLERVPAWCEAEREISEQQLAELRQLAAYCGLYDRALRILSRREHFPAELRRKLRTAPAGLFTRVDEQLVEQVLAECLRLGYLDERRAAHSAAAQLLAHGGIGRARLRSELYRRGCPKELVEEAIAAAAPQLDEAAEVARLLKAQQRHFARKLETLQRKLEAKGGHPALVRRELRLKLGAAVMAYLAGRGFSDEDTRRAARQVVSEMLEEEL